MNKELIWHLLAAISGLVMLVSGILGFYKIEVPFVILGVFMFYGGSYLIVLAINRVRGKQ